MGKENTSEEKSKRSGDKDSTPDDFLNLLEMLKYVISNDIRIHFTVYTILYRWRVNQKLCHLMKVQNMEKLGSTRKPCLFYLHMKRFEL